VPKAITKVLRSRTVQTTDNQDPQHGCKETYLNRQANLEAKPLHKEGHQKGKCINQI
jgi:hypothetical protein